MSERSNKKEAKPPSDPARGHGVRFLKFGAVGGVNTIVDFGVYAILVVLGLTPWLANVASFMTANAGSYFMNARYTFRENDGPAKLSLGAYGRFFSAHIVALMLSTAIVATLTGLMGPYLSKFLAIGVTMIWGYFASAFLVFRDKGKS